MAESAYHMEALRRQRVIDRKRAALDKMVNGGSQVCKIMLKIHGKCHIDHRSLNFYQ